jgi:hypothetical protein
MGHFCLKILDSGILERRTSGDSEMRIQTDRSKTKHSQAARTSFTVSPSGSTLAPARFFTTTFIVMILPVFKNNCLFLPTDFLLN